MSITEDEAEFESLFTGKPFSAEPVKQRVTRERRTADTAKDLARKAMRRTANMNFRVTPSFKALAFGLTEHLSQVTGAKVSIADMLEEAVAALAKKRGYSHRGSE